MQRSQIRDKFVQAGIPGFHFISSGLRLLSNPSGISYAIPVRYVHALIERALSGGR